MAERKLEPTFLQAEDFGDFCMLRLQTDSIDRNARDAISDQMNAWASSRRKLFYIDITSVKKIDDKHVEDLAGVLFPIKHRVQNLEIVMIADESLLPALEKSVLANSAKFFYRENASIQRSRLAKSLQSEEKKIQQEVTGRLQPSIESSLILWNVSINKFLSAKPYLPQGSDIGSTLNFNVEGYGFQLVIAMNDKTLCQILSRNLGMTIESLAPDLWDGANEILNFISSAMRSSLVDKGLSVESGTPAVSTLDELAALDTVTALHLCQADTPDGVLTIHLLYEQFI